MNITINSEYLLKNYYYEKYISHLHLVFTALLIRHAYNFCSIDEKLLSKKKNLT